MNESKLNHAGGETYERSLREQVLQVLTTSTLAALAVSVTAPVAAEA